jgi:signal transduction histidine kinase
MRNRPPTPNFLQNHVLALPAKRKTMKMMTSPNISTGTINIVLRPGRLEVSNETAGGPLDKDKIFSRFFHSAGSHKGYGLGLSIVKSICTFHGWKVDYRYVDHRHTFIVGTGV